MSRLNMAPFLLSCLVAALALAMPMQAMAQRGLPPAPAPGGQVDSVSDLLAGLEARLARTPEDRDGWVLLAKSYHYLERYEESKIAFARARELGYEGEPMSLSTGAAQPRSLSKGGTKIHQYIGDTYAPGSENQPSSE